MSQSDTAKAICYLEQNNDNRNKIILKESELVITYRGRTENIKLTQIKGFDFGHRRAMLYLIGGGIVAPLTMVAFYRDFLNPWPTLFLFFSGIFAMYIGWRGYQVFSIELFGLTHDYRLNQISKNLRAFVNFTTKLLPVNHNLEEEIDRMIFHITDSESWHKYKSRTHFMRPEGNKFIHASTKDQLKGTWERYFKGRRELLLITIDPLNVNPEIKYEDLTQSSQLFPHIYGDLNLDAVVKVEEFVIDKLPN